MRRLILIDGNAIMHRAFHALPDLTAPNGDLVNAVYGFFSMFLRVLEDQKPENVIVCFDRPKPTFRQSLYAGYHAHRPAMADGMVPQIQIIHDALSKMKAAIFEVDGYEADDVIGTLARQATESQNTQTTQRTRKSANQTVRKSDTLTNQSTEFSESSEKTEVIIVTGDRDLLQLVNKHVKVLSPVIGLKETILYDEAKVEEKFGVKPSQFIDYKALVGDASDGYPGVTGIGPKTASGLIQKYGTFENLYKHIADLPEKIGVRLATDIEQASLAKKLATIITDVPITIDMDKCSTKQFDIVGLKEAFEVFGFKSLIKRIGPQLAELEVKEKEAKEGKQLGLL